MCPGLKMQNRFVGGHLKINQMTVCIVSTMTDQMMDGLGLILVKEILLFVKFSVTFESLMSIVP